MPAVQFLQDRPCRAAGGRKRTKKTRKWLDKGSAAKKIQKMSNASFLLLSSSVERRDSVLFNDAKSKHNH
jgi:hypothetical protein